MKIKNVERKVRAALKDYPPCRDDDMQLFGYIILNNFGEGQVKQMSGWQMLGHIMHSRVPHFTSVLRCRQKLQELEPELRGEKYEKRHKRNAEVKDEIINWVENEKEHKQGDLFNGR